MHESSRKVAETLQEIYSPEWDGHGELRAIAEVSAGCPQGSPGGLGGLGGPGCHRCPCPCPRRAMTSCGMTTRRSWPTKPCGSWRITWLSSGTLRCPPARAGGVGDRGEHGGVLAHLSAPPPGAHRQAGPKARGLRQRPAPPGGSAERQEKGRGQNRQGWDSRDVPAQPPSGDSPQLGTKPRTPPVPPRRLRRSSTKPRPCSRT